MYGDCSMRKIFLLLALVLPWSCGLAQVASNPHDHLTAWYKCIGDASATGTIPTTGTTVYDSSGFGNAGTYTGTRNGSHSGTYYSAGAVGPNACYFDGSTNYVSLVATNPSALNLGTNSFTVSFWMTPSTMPSSSYVVPLSFQTSGNTSRVFCQLKYSDGVSYLFCLAQDTNGVKGGINTNRGLFAAGHSYMVTMTMNRAAHIFSLYINGILVGTDSVVMTGNVDLSAATAKNCLGGNGCTSAKFNGTLNDVRVYNTALTNRQVAALYAGDLAENSTPQIPGQLASLSVAGTSAYVVPNDFMGWSIEFSYAGPIMGQASTGTDYIIRQMAGNLTNVSGGKLYIRLGGNSTDSTTTAYAIEPEVEFLAATNSEFSAGVSAKTSTLAQQEAEAAVYVRGIPSIALELGNEPDAYGISSATYLTNMRNFLSPVHTSYPSTLFVGPSCIVYFCTSMAVFPPAVFAAGAAYGLTTGTTHSYEAAAGSCASPYNCLLQPSAYLPSQPTYLSQYAVSAHSSGHQFRVNEMNNLSGGGQRGVSNTFSSALWLIANAMTMAQNTVDGINIHGGYTTGSGSYYDPFQITLTAGTPNTFSVGVIQPIYYGMLFFDRATQNNAAIYPVKITLNRPCSVSGWTACIQAWETKDTSGNYRLALVNLDEVNAGNVVVSNPASTASVCYLSAPSYRSTSGVRFAGQTFDGSTDGTIQGTASYTTLTPSGGVFKIPMAITQAAIVRFGVSSGC
jgi:hypothetical protein